MVPWIIWLILAAVLGAAEVVTLTFALGLLALAAAAAAAVGAAGIGVPLQIVTFVAAAGAGLGLVRPIAMRHIKQPPPLRSGAAALIGRSALVLQDVNGYGGRVRIGGEEWSARSYDETLVIPAGATVDVIEIEGASALVYPRE